MRNPFKSISVSLFRISLFLRTEVWSTYIDGPLDAASILSIVQYSPKIAFPARMSHQTWTSGFLNWSHLVSTPRSLGVVHSLILTLFKRNLRKSNFWHLQMALQGIIPSPFFCVSVILFLNAGFSYYSVSQKIMIPLGKCKDELFTWEESLPMESVQEMGGR